MMAKPKHGRLDSVHPRAHSRSFPSQAVLSALAVIATASPVVTSAPLPPTQPPAFLCPLIERDHISLPEGSVSASYSLASPGQTNQLSKCDVVAVRYVQGSDTLWRRTDRWTLYGSTCSSSLTASTTAVEPQPSSSSTPMSTSALTADFDTSALPVGWNNTTTLKSSTESTIILALAIVLAGSICLFMIGCVIWRRRKKKARDIERKLGRKRDPPDDPRDNEREIDAQGKMRLWAKATARWKSNVRQSARRRRKRHVLSPVVNRPLSPTLSDLPRLSLVGPSTLSRRSSITSEEPVYSRPEVVSCSNGNVTEPLTVTPRSASPPTYGASFAPIYSCLHPRTSTPNPSSASSPAGPYAVQCSSPPSFIDNELLPHIPPSDGHVAIDDKSRLAQIQELASRPMIIDEASASTMQSGSAPEWHEVEDDLENLGIDLSDISVSSHNLGLPPSFPLPPSKADVRLPFGYLDDHPLCYGDGDGNSLPYPGSPRSSLEAFASAPPIDSPGLQPSAPSLENEDELFQDWDGTSSYVLEALTSADLDSAPARAIESPISSTVSSTSRIPSIPESAARDGTLPRYHP